MKFLDEVDSFFTSESNEKILNEVSNKMYLYKLLLTNNFFLNLYFIFTFCKYFCLCKIDQLTKTKMLVIKTCSIDYLG